MKPLACMLAAAALLPALAQAQSAAPDDPEPADTRDL